MTIADITVNVATHFGVTVAQLRSTTRECGLTWPRHIAAWAADTYSDSNRPTIGRYFGRTRSWVNAAVEAVERRRMKGDMIYHDTKEVIHKITSGSVTTP